MTRYTIEMSKEMEKVLEDLVQKEGVSTRAEVIRRAIALLRVARDEIRKGKKIAVTDEDGKVEKELVLT